MKSLIQKGTDLNIKAEFGITALYIGILNTLNYKLDSILSIWNNLFKRRFMEI